MEDSCSCQLKLKKRSPGYADETITENGCSHGDQQQEASEDHDCMLQEPC